MQPYNLTDEKAERYTIGGACALAILGNTHAELAKMFQQQGVEIFIQGDQSICDR